MELSWKGSVAVQVGPLKSFTEYYFAHAHKETINAEKIPPGRSRYNS